MPETWYEVKPHMRYEITPIEVTRSTETSIFREGQSHRRRETRQAKVSDYSSVFPTRREAVEWVRGQVAETILILERQIEYNRKILDSLPVPVVHHVDGNPHNNDISNLRVVALDENRRG